ncbi:MAG: acetyltransferase family protein [Mucilaginibacter sp.]|nr:acetyltransferase family protein [Mucilaginibacter sp.]
MERDSILETPRLVLEPLFEKHAEVLFESLQDENIYKYIEENPPVDLVALKKRYKVLEKRLSPNGEEFWLNWAIKEKSSNDYMGIIQATVYKDLRANLAYIISPNFWKKGFTNESCIRILKLLFTDYKVHEVVANVDINNFASQRVLEKLGFKKEKNDLYVGDYFYVLKS